eukprot:jgi/Galph1/5696/GphlegSOOS_G4348.1
MVEIGGEVVNVDVNETFAALYKLLTPKFLKVQFPLEASFRQVSRILLRREFIRRWNEQVRSLGNPGVGLYPKQVILSAASGMGKSIDLYLTAVLARHCKLIVQYFANTSSILKCEDDEKLCELFLKMLLFMNAESLDSIQWRYATSVKRQKHLNGLSLKQLILYALLQRDFGLCFDIRDMLMTLRYPNMIIVDEHNALWRKFGNDPNSWPVFFGFYASIADMTSDFCGVLIAGSQHHAFEDYLPSGYEPCVKYLDPLNMEEYEKWKQLPDYPDILREHEVEMMELSGLVPRMIARLVSLSKYFKSFEEISANFVDENFEQMKKRHKQYVRSLNPDSKPEFHELLYSLFLDRSIPVTRLADGAYRDRGLLIATSEKKLRFYNSLARDILFKSFLDVFKSEQELARLADRFRSATDNFVYVDIAESGWEIYLFQTSISNFRVHNRGTAALEKIFEPSSDHSLAKLLEIVFGEPGYSVSTVLNEDKNRDFDVRNPRGKSCKDRIFILYATNLPRGKAFSPKSAPKYIHFVTLEDYPDKIRQFLTKKPKGRSRAQVTNKGKRSKKTIKHASKKSTHSDV